MRYVARVRSYCAVTAQELDGSVMDRPVYFLKSVLKTLRGPFTSVATSAGICFPDSLHLPFTTSRRLLKVVRRFLGRSVLPAGWNQKGEVEFLTTQQCDLYSLCVLSDYLELDALMEPVCSILAQDLLARLEPFPSWETPAFLPSAGP